MEVIVSTLGIVLILSFITFLANLADIRQETGLKALLIFSLLGLNFMVVASGILAVAMPENENIESAELALGGLTLVISAVAGLLLLLPSVRQWTAQFFPQGFSQGLPEKPTFPMMNTLNDGDIEFGDFSPKQPVNRTATVGFRPESWVHLWALMLVLLVIGLQISSYFLSGGLEGVADDIGVDYATLFANLLPMVIIPFLGVGIFLRRTPRQAFERLGLGGLTWTGVGASFAITFGLLSLVFIFNVIWLLLVSEETYNEQTEAIEALNESINTVGLAFMLAATAAIGEEIAFRGGLQPVFGFWATAFIFTIIHVQYTLTPAAFLIFFVAIALGWVRQRFNTTTAILVHFLYNFTPLLLGQLAPDAQNSFIRLLF